MREIFQRYADGESVSKIRQNLSARGIKTKTGGDQLSYNSINKMIRNRKYMGEYRYGDTIIPGGMPIIVPPELFERAQERLEKNKRAPAKSKAKVEYLLTTKLYCGRCGGYMVGESGTSKTLRIYNYYKCLCNKRKKRMYTEKSSQERLDRATCRT